MIRVGFVGLGDIGKPMATCLAGKQEECGLHVVVFDLAPEPVAALVAAGAKAGASVAQMAIECDVLCIMVNDDQQVRTVIDEALGAVGGREGRLAIVIHSTVAPHTPAELGAKAAELGVRLLDAPVSGGALGAGSGQLALMIGGTPEDFMAVRVVMAALSAKVVHAGPIGAGTQFKLARNLMHYAAYAAATEAQRLAEAAGLDVLALGDVVRHTDALTGGPGAIMHRDTTAQMEPGTFWYDAFSGLRQLAEKDLSFAIELADELSVEVPFARLARERLAPGLGFPPED
jgi:3-hydroxyisobutyrate dehydrogenase